MKSSDISDKSFDNTVGVCIFGGKSLNNRAIVGQWRSNVFLCSCMLISKHNSHECEKMRDGSSRIVRQIYRPVIKSFQLRPVLRAAAYCRVSTDHEEQLGSLSCQQKYYQELIESNSRWLMAGIYADCASGRNITRRPQFCQLLADCRSGLVDLIITKSISRFGRNTLDS